MELITLFISFLQVGLFSIGGGYAAIPLIQEQAVIIHKWLTMKEFIDLITIAEMTPGPIAINSATFVGTKVYGFVGAIVATLGSITPSIIIVTVLAMIYYKYKETSFLKNILKCLRPTVVALIASAGIGILIQVVFKLGVISITQIDYIGLVLFIIALFVLKKYKMNPIITMVSCGIISMVINILI